MRLMCMTDALPRVEIFTDGACSGNPGPGGYGVILRFNGKEKELTGGAPETTNNRMELTAAIEGLAALKRPCAVTLYSDSKYLIDSVQKKWVYNWRQKGYRCCTNYAYIIYNVAKKGCKTNNFYVWYSNVYSWCDITCGIPATLDNACLNHFTACYCGAWLWYGTNDTVVGISRRCGCCRT